MSNEIGGKVWNRDAGRWENVAESAAREAASAERERARREGVRAELADNPFDPRKEVSADAAYVSGRIVKHLWIIFVLLPVVLGILFAILK